MAGGGATERRIANQAWLSQKSLTFHRNLQSTRKVFRFTIYGCGRTGVLQEGIDYRNDGVIGAE
jgi:hypothetical protein